WHAQLPIQEDDAKDIFHIMPSLDAEQLRHVEHYHAVMKKRLDRKVAAIEALRDTDLLLTDIIAPWDVLDIPDVMQRPYPRRQQADRSRERDTHASMMRGQGWDPDEFLPPEEDMPGVVALDDWAKGLESSRQETAQLQQQMEELAAAMWQESGFEAPSKD